jgi:hypothetical protein
VAVAVWENLLVQVAQAAVVLLELRVAQTELMEQKILVAAEVEPQIQ